MAIAREQQTAIDKIFSRIAAALGEAVKPRELDPVARFAIDVIVKRTRLGYGVPRQFAGKEKLKRLTSAAYKKYRSRYRGLDALTSPNMSNLTLTGQMLRSMDIITSKPGSVIIGPTGKRDTGKANNAQVAAYQEKQGRTFNRVSALEYRQILRFYRRTFGDLLGKKKLLR